MEENYNVSNCVNINLDEQYCEWVGTARGHCVPAYLKLVKRNVLNINTHTLLAVGYTLSAHNTKPAEVLQAFVKAAVHTTVVPVCGCNGPSYIY